jgi:hypothetical protein
METEQKMQFIKICKDAFLPQVNVNVENSQSQQNDKQSSSENE